MLVRESDAEEAAAPRAMGLDCIIVSHTTSQIAKSILPIALLQNLHGEAGCGYVSSED